MAYAAGGSCRIAVLSAARRSSLAGYGTRSLQLRPARLHALDVARQRLRIVSRPRQDTHGELVGIEFVLALRREESHGHCRSLPWGCVPAPTAHKEERYGGRIASLRRHLPHLLASHDMRDGVRQHPGEFVLIGRRQDQARGNEDRPARKCSGLVNPGPIVVRQFEGVWKARRGRLCRQALPQLIQVSVHRRRFQDSVLPPVLRSQLRAQRLFFFDLVLGEKRSACQKQSKPHTFIIKQASLETGSRLCKPPLTDAIPNSSSVT